MKPLVSIIAAIGKNRELGKDNKLLWSIPEDMKRFRDKTRNHPVIMGRKTFESIGKVLPHRTNIVITRNRDFKAKDAYVFSSLEKAIDFAKTKDTKEIFIIGGAQIYTQALPLADKLYLTLVDKEYPFADSYFPDYSEFKKRLEEKKYKNEDISYSFIDLIR